jgi:hypothetical protein
MIISLHLSCPLLNMDFQTPNTPNVHRKMILAAAFVPTGQPEINCVAADVSPLHLKNRPQNNEPIHIGCYIF